MNPYHSYCPCHLPRVYNLAPTRALTQTRAGSASFIIDGPGGAKYNAAICTHNGYCEGASYKSEKSYPNPDHHTHIILNTENPLDVPQNAPNIVRGLASLPPSYCYFVVKDSGDSQVMSDSYASPPPNPLPCFSEYNIINEGPGRGTWSEIKFPTK